MQGDWQRSRFRCVQRFLVILIGLGFLHTLSTPPLAQQTDNKLAKTLIEDGITAYQKGQYDEAVSKLTQARSLLPSHSPTVLYLGLAYLKQGKTSEAIAAWEEYSKLKPHTKEEQQGNLPQTIPQYLTLLLREENQRIAREAVAREQSLGPSDPQTVAITYYRNLGSPELGPLQKGLTALLISDISQVKELKVVERDLLQALLDELQLGASGAVDEKTAPKVGRLLGAGKVATGSYLDTGKEELRVDSLVAESTTAQVINTQESSGKLEQFYALEKGLALAILNDLGYDEQRLRAAGVWDSIRQPQTTSLPALTAFSQGLDAKDRGDYPAARTQFEQALAADPNFELARKELLALPLVALATGGIIAAVSSSAPSASSATAGIAATTAGLSTTTLAIAAGVVAAGAGAGAGIAASQGDDDDNNGPRCGNGRIEAGEQCDPPGACCSQQCQLVSAGTECRGAAGDCSLPAVCTGTSATCPDNGFQPAGTECRPEAPGGCDVADFCTGDSATCPDNFRLATDTCRPEAPGGCDVAELCPGNSATCPADAFRPATDTCRPEAPGGCDVAELCPGNSITCPADAFRPATDTCRPEAPGGCDVAELCPGNSITCPPDIFEEDTTSCGVGSFDCCQDGMCVVNACAGA